jgi:hypothetical protein
MATLSSSSSSLRVTWLISATTDYHQQEFDPGGALKDAEKTGWAISPEMGKTHQATFELENPIT